MVEQAVQSEEFVIDGIWILKNNSGVCLFEEIYVDFKKEGISKDLVSGLLSAIVSFIQDAFIDKLEYLMFSNRRLVLKYNPHVLFVVAISAKKVEDSDFKSHIEECMNKINDAFNAKYFNLFESKKWDGNIVQFYSFTEALQKIVHRTPLDIELLNIRRIRRKTRRKLERRMRRYRELFRLAHQIQNLEIKSVND
ncbi:MAG: hypothetical protein ACFFAS_20580 [Promethearchaeota archaeon]